MHLERAFPFSQDENSPVTNLSLDLWDLAATEISAPQLSEDWEFAYENGILTGSRDGRFMGYLQEAGGAWLDRKTDRIIGWEMDAASMPVHQRSKPCALLLAIWLADRNVQIIHSGLVSLQGKGVLLAGSSGSGKTTASLLCHRAGFAFLGDDFVGIRQSEPDLFEGLCFFHSVRLTPSQLKHFPELSLHAIDGDEKILCYLGETEKPLLNRSTRITAIVFPKVAPDKPLRLSTLSKGKALLQLSYNSLRIPSYQAQSRMDQLAALIEAVPTYKLEMGPDMERIPGKISEILSGLDL